MQSKAVHVLRQFRLHNIALLITVQKQSTAYTRAWDWLWNKILFPGMQDERKMIKISRGRVWPLQYGIQKLGLNGGPQVQKYIFRANFIIIIIINEIYIAQVRKSQCN